MRAGRWARSLNVSLGSRPCRSESVGRRGVPGGTGNLPCSARSRAATPPGESKDAIPRSSALRLQTRSSPRRMTNTPKIFFASLWVMAAMTSPTRPARLRPAARHRTRDPAAATARARLRGTVGRALRERASGRAEHCPERPGVEGVRPPSLAIGDDPHLHLLEDRSQFHRRRPRKNGHLRVGGAEQAFVHQQLPE